MIRANLFVIIFALLLSACASSRSLDASMSDLSRNADFKGILFSDRSHDYSDIDITIFEGRLMLTGTMRSADGRDKLVENAWQVDGVKQVIDEVFVGDRTPFGQGLADARIDQALKTRMLTSENVTSSNFKVAVSRSIVYLIGVVPNRTELDVALEIAKTTGGVQQVVTHAIVQDPLTRLQAQSGL